MSDKVELAVKALAPVFLETRAVIPAPAPGWSLELRRTPTRLEVRQVRGEESTAWVEVVDIAELTPDLDPEGIAELIATYLAEHPVSVAWADLSERPQEFPPEAHRHNASEIDDLPPAADPAVVEQAVRDYLAANPPSALPDTGWRRIDSPVFTEGWMLLRRWGLQVFITFDGPLPYNQIRTNGGSSALVWMQAAGFRNQGAYAEPITNDGRGPAGTVYVGEGVVQFRDAPAGTSLRVAMLSHLTADAFPPPSAWPGVAVAAP